jgi:diguanylate cyclase (GGDEF)-like protein
MTITTRLAALAMLIVAACGIALYATLGTAKPYDAWNWMDIVGEGGTSVMSAIWSLIVVGSRPTGRVTALLAGGLAAIALGSWADFMDEFFAIPHEQYWDNWLESLPTISGMLTLTAGMYFWRQEQFSLNEHMQKRERLFRDHRAFDRITQLADADYLRRQIHLERERTPERPCAVVLLDIDEFQPIVRLHGQREGNRLLQAISHLLLLNLRPDDLLCRYAGDRFAILMPATDHTEASHLAGHLAQAVRDLTHYSRDGGTCIVVTARIACALADTDADRLLGKLNAVLESAPPIASATA